MLCLLINHQQQENFTVLWLMLNHGLSHHQFHHHPAAAAGGAGVVASG
jgi:hypothetical protein